MFSRFSHVKCLTMLSSALHRNTSLAFRSKHNFLSLLGTRHFSRSKHLRNDFLSEKIVSRSVVKLAGSDAPNFLQGLVTNDICVLENTPLELSMYCMILNTQGRVLYDLILYKVNKYFGNDCSILIECDTDACEDLIKVFSRYKLKKKDVSFTRFEELSVWSLFPKFEDLPPSSTSLPPTDQEPAAPQLNVTKKENIVFSSRDPRIPNFGYRLLLPANMMASDTISNCTEVTDHYQERRFEFGLSEGVIELPMSHCLPMESNLLFLNGVSFSKGCYVGQELTARSHHTGVIRKRIMPILSRNPINADSSHGDTRTVTCQTTNKECGKVRSWNGRRGLAVLRLQETLLCPGPLVLRDSGGAILGEVETFVPNWWPTDDEVIKKIKSKQEKI